MSRSRIARTLTLLIALIMALPLAGCASDTGADQPASAAAVPSTAARSAAAPAAATGTPIALALPPVAGRFSYQIGGGYAPPGGVTVIDRDHADPPAAGSYSICYLNAFQAQADAVSWWQAHHRDLLLRDRSGALVIDTDWHEPLFDISTAAKRTELLGVVGGWADGCARAGYRAVEADNLDSYTRSHGLLDAADALAFARLLAGRAHHDRLALGQKNAAELSAAGHAAGFDFAVAEECQVYTECDSYTDVYGRNLIEIEYTDQPRAAFTTACAQRGHLVSVVLRDRDVLPAGQSGHVEQWCS